MNSPHQLSEQVAAQIAPLLPAHNRILIGLSGGVDSVVLLHLLHAIAPKFSWQLSALHVHHGISSNADAWAKFCTELCANYRIPLVVERVDIAPLRGQHGIEAAARKLRHAAFAKQPCDVVALAHHADDQSETLLLQLLRGAGVRGASAMPVLSQSKWSLYSVRPDPVEGCDVAKETLIKSNFLGSALLLSSPDKGRLGGVSGLTQSTKRLSAKNETPSNSPLSGGEQRPDSAIRLNQHIPKSQVASIGSGRTESARAILRPLLYCSRQEILDYAATHQLQWIEDESNADDSYPRNFLRHRVLPLLEEKFPAYRDTLARSAQHFAEASGLLDELAQQDAQAAPPLPSWERVGERGGDYDGTLAVAALQSLTQPRAKNLLRYFLHRVGVPMPQAAQLDAMLQQLLSAAEDSTVCLTFGEWQVRRYQGKVYVMRALGKFDKSVALPWHGEACIYWSALDTLLQFKRTQGISISLEKLQHAPVTLRLRQGGETLRPHPKAATRTLKNLLQEHHIPPWQRDRLPLLYCGEELVCVVGVAIAEKYQAAKEEVGISIVAED